MDQVINWRYHTVLEFAERVNRTRHGAEATERTIAVFNCIRQDTFRVSAKYRFWGLNSNEKTVCRTKITF